MAGAATSQRTALRRRPALPAFLFLVGEERVELRLPDLHVEPLEFRFLCLGSSSSSLLLSSLELSNTKVYEPYVRSRRGTAAHFCEVAVLKLRTGEERVELRLPDLRVEPLELGR